MDKFPLRLGMRASGLDNPRDQLGFAAGLLLLSPFVGHFSLAAAGHCPGCLESPAPNRTGSVTKIVGHGVPIGPHFSFGLVWLPEAALGAIVIRLARPLVSPLPLSIPLAQPPFSGLVWSGEACSL